MKKASLIVGLTILMAVVYQNCAPRSFTVDNQDLASEAVKSCEEGEELACETSEYLGSRTCHVLADGSAENTMCLPKSCKPPYIAQWGTGGLVCVSPACQNGQTTACTLNGATGIRACQNGVWENSCHWVKATINNANNLTRCYNITNL